MKEYSIFLRDNLSPQDIMQAFTNFLHMQYDHRQIPRKVVKSITLNIERLGGLEEIEKWLKDNDPGHSVPSQFESMNWDWLREDLRLKKK